MIASDKCLCRHFQKKLKKDRGYCFRPFYNQITPYDVIRWLFNFDDEDVELAVQLLEHVIFLRDDDVKGRLYDQIVKLPNDRRKHIVPLGKSGKSGAAISYWIHGLMRRNELREIDDSAVSVPRVAV